MRSGLYGGADPVSNPVGLLGPLVFPASEPGALGLLEGAFSCPVSGGSLGLPR